MLSASQWIIKVIGSKDFIDSMKKELTNTLAIVVALGQGNKIVHKDVDVVCGLRR